MNTQTVFITYDHLYIMFSTLNRSMHVLLYCCWILSCHATRIMELHLPRSQQNCSYCKSAQKGNICHAFCYYLSCSCIDDNYHQYNYYRWAYIKWVAQWNWNSTSIYKSSQIWKTPDYVSKPYKSIYYSLSHCQTPFISLKYMLTATCWRQQIS
jgi:hypothetical protein